MKYMQHLLVTSCKYVSITFSSVKEKSNNLNSLWRLCNL